MDESYETFEEELGQPRADPPPQKPVRQICRPEMYATRKIREEIAPVPQAPKAEPKTLPKQPSLPSAISLHKTSSVQNLTQIETPWENVTLNRCLFVTITILVLTSGFQRLHETLRGQRTTEEEDVRLRVRQPGTLRYRTQQPEPETSLWEVMFWWLPDLDEDENDKQIKRGKSMKTTQALRGLRNRPLPDKNLMKQRHGRFKKRRARKTRDEEKDKNKKLEVVANDEIEGDNKDENEIEEVRKKNKKLEKNN